MNYYKLLFRLWLLFKPKFIHTIPLVITTILNLYPIGLKWIFFPVNSHKLHHIIRSDKTFKLVASHHQVFSFKSHSSQKEDLMMASNKPKLFAYWTCIWCCVWPFTGKFVRFINNTTVMNHLIKWLLLYCQVIVKFQNLHLEFFI